MQYLTAAETINNAAVEVGVAPVANPYSSADDTFVQLKYLLNSSGKRLVYHYPWEELVREYAFTTDARDPQEYPLPADFKYMIDQTGWMRDQNVPLGGPLSAQDWQYLQGRDLVSSTIYASFRLNNGVMKLWPSESLINGTQTIAYEYVSENWVKPDNENNRDNFKSAADQPSDIILYPDPLPMLYLKARFLGSKGMDTSAADAEFSDAFLSLTGLNKGAPILRADGMSRGAFGMPYLNTWRNVPDTKYGNW